MHNPYLDILPNIKSNPRPMKRLVPMVFLIALAACGRHDKRPSAAALPAVPVVVMTATLEPHTAEEEVVGTVRSKKLAVVEAKVSGRVLEYHATPGALVKAGDLLARLEVQEIQAKVDQAMATLDQTQRDFERQKVLIATSATSRQEYDAAQARLKVAEAGLSEAETMMGYARVTAPFDGVITRKLADVGDLAMPGKPLLEIESPTALRFEADLPEALLEHVIMGAMMKVSVASVEKPIEATVSEIAPVADPSSRTFMVKLDLPGVAGLRSGQFGRVSVPVKETELLWVPESAVIRRGQMELVFVAGGGHALLRLVKTGRRISDRTVVLSGLEVGEQVVTGDVTKLADGQPVTVKP